MNLDKYFLYEILITLAAGLLFFGVVFRITSFMWAFGGVIVLFFMVLTGILPIISFVIDYFRKTRFLAFSVAILLAFWTCFFAQRKVVNLVQHSIEQKAENTITRIDQYNLQKGAYPDHLELAEFKDVDLSTMLGKDLQYRLTSDTSYQIYYSAFHGGYRYYNSGAQDWYWDD